MYPIPKEAYSYWPDGENILIENKDFVERLIFSRQTYKDWEVSALNQLNKLIKSENVHEYMDESDKLRFLYGSGWKFSETLSTLESHIEWKQDWPAYKLIYPLITQILNSGGVYIHGRDHRYRPIIVVTPSKLLGFQSHLLMATAYFLLEHVKDHMLLPGQIENWVLIVDCAGLEGKDFPKKLIIDLLTHYPCRLAKAFLYNTGKFVTNVLKLFSNNTLQKVFIDGKNEILSFCNPAQVEARFGGVAENLANFWPPFSPSSNFQALGDPAGGFLSNYSSYEEYLVPPKINSDLSSLKVSQQEEYKESFISNSEFKDEIWQKLEIVSGSFSFLQTDVYPKAQETEAESKIHRLEVRGKSEDMTRTSSNAAKKISMEQEFVESSCCVQYACSIQ